MKHQRPYYSARILVLGLAALIALVLPGNLWAQTNISGDIAGTVVDSSGAAIPGATVKITNSETGATQEVTTASAGEYRAALLQPGNYTVVASAPNFQSSQMGVAVSVGQTSTANLMLAVARGTQTVEVQATSTPLLQPENSDLSTTISMQQVQNLPNPGGDITYFINLTQGAVMNTQGGYGNTSVFGLPATSNNFTQNGAQVNDPFLNLNNSGPSNLLLGSNDIAEVNIVANAYSANYGGLGGVQQNVISRSGANHFHGNATYYWTNSDMNANNWFNNNTGAPTPYANANQWGAAVGGPIVKDKAFFFVNYEGLRFVTSVPNFVVLPSAAYQAAVLSNLATNGNAAQIPFYQKMFNLYNGAPGASRATEFQGEPWANAYNANSKNNLYENLVTARYDQKLGPNDNMFIHFKWDHGLQPTYIDPIDPIFNAQSDQPDYEGQAEWTHTFSPNVVNQFLLSGSWYSAYFLSVNQAAADAAFPYTMGFSFGDASFQDLRGSGYNWPQGRDVTQYQINDDVSWNKGKHGVSFGFIFKRNDVTDKDLGIFSTALGIQTGPSAAAPTVNPDGSLTVSSSDVFGNGSLFAAVQNFPARGSAPISIYSLGFYGQDQWKITSNFQFSYGLRIEHNSNPVCTINCFAHLGNSYSAVTADLDTPYNKVIQTGLRNAFQNLQAYTVNPRIGFTFSPPNHPNTVIRGGYGMFTDIFPATVADSLLSNPPLNPQFTVAGYLADPAQPGSADQALTAVNETFKTGFASGGSFNSISTTNPNFTMPNVINTDHMIHYPTYQQWSLQWQQQIGRNTAFQVGYVGNHGYHEPIVNQGVNISQASVPVDPTTGLPLFTGLPANPALPAFANVQEIQSGASSNYNGLIASLKYQEKWVTGTLNYTWSHALDMISNGGFLPLGNPAFANTIQPINPFNIAQNYGNADYDIRNNINGNYLVHVPYLGGPHVLTDGWTFGGTIFWHSGFPFSVKSSAATSALNAAGGYGSSSAMLAAVVSPNVPHHCGKNVVTGCFGGDAATGTPSPYFADPTSFSQIQARNQFFGPGFFNTDFTLLKSFKIPVSETTRLEVGATGYNILNHPNFLNPAFDFDNIAAFGLVTRTASVPTSVFGSFLGGDASPRIIQLRAKFEF